MKKLIIAGSGIKFLSHLTVEVKAAIETSSCVVYLLNEPAIKKWVSLNSKKSITLDELYFSSSLRADSYNKIANEIIAILEEHNDIVFLIYGHPTYFSSIVPKLIEKISLEQVDIQIMPGISALDCLFSDLRVDPGVNGLQSYDATEFILYDHAFSKNVHLVLWQIAIIGEIKIISDDILSLKRQAKALEILYTKLARQYPDEHFLYLYIASQYPSIPFEAIKIRLIDLLDISIPRLATLYIPPIESNKMRLDILNQLEL